MAVVPHVHPTSIEDGSCPTCDGWGFDEILTDELTKIRLLVVGIRRATSFTHISQLAEVIDQRVAAIETAYENV